MKKQPIEWEKIFANQISDKGANIKDSQNSVAKKPKTKQTKQNKQQQQQQQQNCLKMAGRAD